MKPLYFGPTEKQLFGVYHEPQIQSAVSQGVVLCYPMGQEYYYTHRAFLQLAFRLAKAGVPVLRFDYFGCGDSAGDSISGNINEWLGNVDTAVNQIRNSGNVKSVSLIGFRLGATLAMLAGGSRSDVRNIVLWEPIINGMDYVKELSILHGNWLQSNLLDSVPDDENGDVEVIGMPFTPELQEGLNGIDLLSLDTRVADSIAVVASNNDESYAQLVEKMKSCAREIEYQHITGAQDLFTDAGMDTMHVPVQTLQFIVQWIKKVCV